MEKSTKILLIIAAILGTLVVAVWWEPTRIMITDALQHGVLTNLYFAGVMINDWLELHTAGLVAIGGVLGGLGLAVVINTLVRPRVHIGMLHKSTSSPASSYSTSTLSSTPSSATIRPESPPVQKVEIEVKTPSTPKEETKEAQT